jgi:4-amino-4-deoxy-L-arabinose transferase-like glycosyltransferase
MPLHKLPAKLVLSMLPSLTIWRIVLIGVLLRIFWSVLIPVVPISDSVAYDTFAINIWQHGTYGWTASEPTSFWPVGTSALYALLYKLFGHQYAIITILNIIFSAGVIYYTYKITQIFFNKTIAQISALLIAVWPTMIFYSTILASELPYMFFTLIGIYYFFSDEDITLKSLCILGISFAAAYYIRPLAVTTLIISTFCAVVFLKQNTLKTTIKFVTTVVTIIVAVTPWAYRNYALYDHIVPMSTNGGAVFWMGNSPGTEGDYHQLPTSVGNLNEYERNKVLKQEAITYIQDFPVEFIYRTTTKFLKFHSHETIGVTWNEKGITETLGPWWIMPLKMVSQGFWLLCLIGAIAGVMIYLRQERSFISIFHPFLLFWLGSAALHALIVAQDRYHIPIIPFMSAFFAYGIYFVLSLNQPKKTLVATNN